MADIKQEFKEGVHHHYYNLKQQELDLESKEAVTFRTWPKLIKHLDERATRECLTRSKLIETIIVKHLKSEQKIKELYKILDDIIG